MLRMLRNEHVRALASGAVCVVAFVMMAQILSTTTPTVFAAYLEEYPTHREIMSYMSAENARVAVIQENQERTSGVLPIMQTSLVNHSERLALLEQNVSALTTIAWATMVAVFGMLGKSIFEVYQRSSLASVRKEHRMVAENEQDNLE